MGKLISYSIEPTRNLKFFILIISGVLLIALSGGCSISLSFDKSATYKAKDDLDIFLRSDHTERCEPVSSMELDFTAAKPDEYGIQNVSLQYPIYLPRNRTFFYKSFLYEYIIYFFKIGNGDGETLSTSAEAIIYALSVYMDNTGIYSNISPAIKLRLFVDQEEKECIFLPISITDPAVENISYGKGTYFNLAYGVKISLGLPWRNPSGDRIQTLTIMSLTPQYRKSLWKENKIRSISSEFAPLNSSHILLTKTTIDLDGEKIEYIPEKDHQTDSWWFSFKVMQPEQESIND